MSASLSLAFDTGGRATPRPERSLPPEELARLAVLRRYVALSRLDCSQDLDKMCALIVVERRASAERYAIAFFRTLARVARRPLLFHPIRSARASEDEMWLLRLLDAYRSGDEASAAALIGFRVDGTHRRLTAFLARGLARTADALS